MSASTITDVFRGLERTPEGLLGFLMRNYYELEEPKASRPGIKALTIGSGYLFGGLLPLIPYFCVKHKDAKVGFHWSLGVMCIALFTFGYVKTAVDEGWWGKEKVKSALFEAVAMLFIGGAAVGFAILVILGINHKL